MTPLRQILGLPLLLAYSVALIWASIPDEVRPKWLDRGYRIARGFFDRLGVSPSHTVFGGYPGDVSRKYWAARFVGVGPTGEATTLLEWPKGMVQPYFRAFEDPVDVVWYRSFRSEGANRLMRAKSPESRARCIEDMRKDRDLDHVLDFFCTAAPFGGPGAWTEVRLEAFWAGISYRTGEIFPGRATLHATDCRTRRSTDHWPLPEDPPMWPLLPVGFHWDEVR